MKENRFSSHSRKSLRLLLSKLTRLSFTFIVDLSVSVDVCFPDHLVHFLVRELFSEVGHDVAQLCGANVAIAVLGEKHYSQSRTLHAVCCRN